MDKLAHRKSTTTLTLRDAQGNLMPGRKVEAELKQHEFMFGTGIFWLMDLLDPATAPERKERLQDVWGKWQAVFNFGTLPFYQGRYEPVEGKTMQEATLRAAKEMTAHGYLVKGHPLCWHTVAAKWLMAKDNDAVLANQLGRIEREINAFKEHITFWDVINEVVIMPEFEKEDNAITRLCQRMGRVPLIKVLFEKAKAMDPNATLLLNDFNTSERYRRLVEDCLAAGVPIDVIGIQSHQHQGFWGMEKLLEVLERFEGFGKPIHFTENTFVSGDLMPPHIVDLNDWQVPSWPTTPAGEDRQARDMLAMADTLFAHPLVEAFINWNFEDGGWLGAPAGLLRLDGTPKPAYEALRQRICQDWHTRVTLQTDENGQCQVEGFRGRYVLRAEGREASFVLDRETKAQEITV